jgi:hypothetical protein
MGAPTHEWIKKQIRRHGVAVISVRPDPGAAPDAMCFHYTVGLHGDGLPELLLIGGEDLSRALEVLADLAEVMRERPARFADGELVSLGGKYPVKVINVGHANLDEAWTVRMRYTCAVQYFYGTIEYDVQQMLVSDLRGRYPGNPACAEPYASCRLRVQRAPVPGAVQQAS